MMHFLKEKIKTPDGTILYEKQDLDEKAKLYSYRSKNVFKKWDVYWTAVRFLDDPRYYKIRPVIIQDCLNDKELNVLYCSSKDKENRYAIKQYMNLGFIKPAYVLYDKPGPVEIKYVFNKANKPLSKEDQRNINNLWI